MSKSKKAFISYKWENEEVKSWVERFATDLRQNGVDALLDIWEVSYGESFIEYMTSKIPSASFFLFIMTPGAVTSIEKRGRKGGAVKFEVQMAEAQAIAGEKLRFIPILYKGDEIPKHLRAIRYADFRDPKLYNSAFKALLDTIKGVQNKPPVLGVSRLQYDTHLYGLMYSGGIAAILAKMEPYVGFPFYSYESDNPTRWPVRVYEDRKKHTEKIVSFITDPSFVERIDAALQQNGSNVQTFSNRILGTKEQQEEDIVQKYTNLRLICNSTLGEDADKIRELLGNDVSAAFMELERERDVIRDRMPNRLFTVGLAVDRNVLLEDVTISLTIVGEVYDIMLDGNRVIDRQQIDGLGVSRKFTLNLGSIHSASTATLRIWYNYMPIDKFYDPGPIRISAEPTQGVVLGSLGAKGAVIEKKSSLVNDEGVYSPYNIDFTFPEA
jgi:hypothetical protein